MYNYGASSSTLAKDLEWAILQGMLLGTTRDEFSFGELNLALDV
jgi:hypothetical protein